MTRNPTRRELLGGIAGTTITSLGGCTSSGDTTVFETVTVEETDLVVELVDDHPLERLSIARPDGELFAEAPVQPGVSRKTFRVGVEYLPGEYELIGLSDGSEHSSTSLRIEPDVRVADLRLGRNHPQEIEDDIDPRIAETEAIIDLENQGTGPDAVEVLNFSGDVPRPTPETRDGSGILDVQGGFTQDAEQVLLPPGETVTIYSNSMPFNSTLSEIECDPDTNRGQFEAVLQTKLGDKQLSQAYSVSYTGKDMSTCDIGVEAQE